MKIVAHLGVLDEVDLIARVVDHLFRIGVDQIIAFDMGSADGTLEVLQSYRGAHLALHRLNPWTPWNELHARTVHEIQGTNADWILLLDADEFWLPATGSLRACLAGAVHDVAVVDRFNVVLTDDGPAMPDPLVPENYDRIYLHTRRLEDFRQHLEDHPETPWITGVPVPKVIARREFIGSVGMGGHDVLSVQSESGSRARAADLIVAHFPFSTLDRFRKRVANISEFFELNPDYFEGSQGWHWRRLYELHRGGKLREEFERQVVERGRLDELIEEGSVQTASEILGLAQRD